MTIARTFAVEFKHRVHFTRGLFAPSNSLLRGLLADPPRAPKALVVLDEGLARARPDLAGAIESYFAGLEGQVVLAGPPLVIEGRRAGQDVLLSRFGNSFANRAPSHRPAFLCDGGGRRRGAGRRRLRRRHRAPRRTYRARPHHRPEPERLRRRRQKRHQRLRQQEFHRHLRPALCRLQRFDFLARFPARDDRAARRGGEGGAHPRCSFFDDGAQADALARATRRR